MVKSWAVLLTLLVSLAALRAGGLPKGLNILGLLVGAVGIISIVPGLTEHDGWNFWLELKSSGSSGWGLCCCAAIQARQRKTNGCVCPPIHRYQKQIPVIGEADSLMQVQFNETQQDQGSKKETK